MLRKVITLENVKKSDARAFGAFLLGKAAGAGIPETPNPDKAGLGRDAEGRVVAQFKNRVLARASFDTKSGMPTVEIYNITPEKSEDGVVGLFQKAYTVWNAASNTKLIESVKAKVQELLDPPKNGEPQVTLNSITRSDIEELSLKDVLKHVLPAGVELVKFERNDQRIRVYYEFGQEGVQVPLLSAWHEDKTTVLRSGDGVSPAPVAFFSNLLEEAKKYNRGVSGPKRLKEILDPLKNNVTEDLRDEEVMAAYAQHLETSQEILQCEISPEVQVAVVPKTQSVYVYIDRKMIAQSKPASDEKMWVRPGYGWSPRSEFAQRALVEAGRRLIAEKRIETGPGKDWEAGLEAELG